MKMIHKIYSIYDAKAQVFTLPFYMTTEQMALRQFTNWVNDPDHTFGRNPEDYTLHSAGEYDDETGTITQETIKSLGMGLQFIIQEEK